MASVIEQVGPRLRALRQARGLTLDQLARSAGLSPSTLSRLESNKRQVSLELLVPLARQLDVQIDDLVREDAVDPRVDRPEVQRDGLSVVPLTRENSPIRVYRITFAPTKQLPELKVHDGYEWLYVVNGRLRLRLGQQDLVLTRGQAAEFDTRVPHAVSAEGKRPAQIVSIFNEAGERMHLHSLDR